MPKKKSTGGGVTVHIAKIGQRRESIVSKIFTTSKDEIRAPAGEGESYTLAPPLSFKVLYWLWENSSALRPCIDVYKTNIDGFGHHFPEKYTEEEFKEAIRIDLERGDAGGGGKPAEAEEEYESKNVSKALLKKIKMWRQEKTWQTKQAEGEGSTDATVEARYKELRKDIDREYAMLDRWFEYACPDMSFVELRKVMREDDEISGNAYWEVARSKVTGRPVKLYYAAAQYIQLCPAKDTVVMPMREQINALDFEVVPVRRRMRTYVQQIGDTGKKTYFKEFGDPRVVSNASGEVYKNEAALKEKEPHAEPATELIHFKIHSGSSPYGMPRWLGAYKLIAGLIEKDQVDLDYYTDGTIPPMVISVSGHTQALATEMINMLTRTFRAAKERGSAAKWDVPIIEAQSQLDSTLVPKVEFHNLMDARLKEATHLKYAEMCKEYIRQMFRLPKFLLGDAADVNRSTSVSILEMTEAQVFAGERKAFDFWVDHTLLPELDVRYHRFKSMGPQVEDLEAMADSLTKLVETWIVTPEEARRHITDNTTLDLVDIKADWAKQPPELTMSGRTPEQGSGDPEVLQEFEDENEA